MEAILNEYENAVYDVVKHQTQPFIDHQLNANGFRKPVKRFLQNNYTENLLQAFINIVRKSKQRLSIIVGGDGRYFSVEFVDKLVKIFAACSKVRKLIIAQNTVMTLPALSHYIRKYQLTYGIAICAGNSFGGSDGFFGIKCYAYHGGLVADQFYLRVQNAAQLITRYNICPNVNVDINNQGEYMFAIRNGEKTHIFTAVVIDPVEDYVQLMRETFEFKIMRNLLKSGTRVTVNAMNGALGPYLKAIMCHDLGLFEYEAVKCDPTPDFGGLLPNPNPITAIDFIELMKKGLHDVGVVFDAEGCRAMVAGKNGYIVPVCDFLAIMLSYTYQMQYFKKNPISGVARPFTTSAAIDRVAKELDIPCYEVSTKPKGWINLMESSRLSIYGDDDFRFGCSMIRERDGLWTFLQFLLVLEIRRTTVQRLFKYHWNKFGRNFYLCLVYENYDLEPLREMMKLILKKIDAPGFIGSDLTANDLYHPSRRRLTRSISTVDKVEKRSRSLNITSTFQKESTNIKLVVRPHDPTNADAKPSIMIKASFEVASFELYKYKDPVDGSVGQTEGVRITSTDGSRIIFRLIEGDVEGNSFRIYIEKYIHDVNFYERDVSLVLETLIKAALELSGVHYFLGQSEPSYTCS